MDSGRSSDARAELESLLDQFSAGSLPSIGFVSRVKALEAANPGLISPDPSLGVALVAGFGNHTSGRDLMSLLLEIEGFRVRNSQIRDSDAELVRMCADPEITVLCISAQSTQSADCIADVIADIDPADRKRVVFNAGGAPVSQSLADRIGCDVFAQSAVESVRLIKAAVQSRPHP
jgi:methanogenic corrinoid protein MtbC1